MKRKISNLSRRKGGFLIDLSSKAHGKTFNERARLKKYQGSILRSPFFMGGKRSNLDTGIRVI